MFQTFYLFSREGHCSLSHREKESTNDRRIKELFQTCAGQQHGWGRTNYQFFCASLNWHHIDKCDSAGLSVALTQETLSTHFNYFFTGHTRACLLMFGILCAFDSAFHSMQFASCALQWQTTNEELCLCLLLFQQAITESCPLLHLSAHIMCSSGDLKTVLHNLR